jgi:hypothetical protein
MCHLDTDVHGFPGPDHLAALLPKCVGKRWFEAAEIGAIWGLGKADSINACLEHKPREGGVGAGGSLIHVHSSCWWS